MQANPRPVSRRRIDHLVLAVQDLAAAARFYERLGFQVGARNRHPWGTENRIVQFQSSFLELITVGDEPSRITPHAAGRFSFGAFVRDYLARREGLAMLVLDSADAAADAAEFARAGIGAYEPFFFERKGRKPDGSETRVAFTLGFATDPGLPEAGFFVCQQHCPEAFWNPAFQSHANGAVNVRSVTLGTVDPAAHAAFLSSFTGTTDCGQGFALQGNGRLESIARHGTGGFAAYSVGVPDLDAVASRLRAEGIPFDLRRDRIEIAAASAFGVDMAFEAI